MDSKQKPNAVLTLKGIEVKARAFIEEIEREVLGVQMAVIFAVPEVDDPDSLSCAAYINMDAQILASAIRNQLSEPLDRLPQIS